MKRGPSRDTVGMALNELAAENSRLGLTYEGTVIRAGCLKGEGAKMDDLQQREATMRERVEKVNAGRKPVFGDRMRNLWAGEENPIRDGIFVRSIRRNHANLYQMTNGKGKFWEVFTSGMVFIEGEP